MRDLSPFSISPFIFINYVTLLTLCVEHITQLKIVVDNKGKEIRKGEEKVEKECI
jgi:hypothetical protein